MGSRINTYSLSFTKDQKKLGKNAIAIEDVNGFFLAIKNDLEQPNKSHKVTWLNLDELKKYGSIVPSINSIQKYPTDTDENVTLNVVRMSGRSLIYVDKSHFKGTSNSPEVAINAHNKNLKDKEHDEWRLELDTGSFKGFSGQTLSHLVQYLKFSCPSIKSYCRKI